MPSNFLVTEGELGILKYNIETVICARFVALWYDVMLSKCPALHHTRAYLSPVIIVVVILHFSRVRRFAY